MSTEFNPANLVHSNGVFDAMHATDPSSCKGCYFDDFKFDEVACRSCDAGQRPDRRCIIWVRLKEVKKP